MHKLIESGIQGVLLCESVNYQHPEKGYWLHEPDFDLMSQDKYFAGFFGVLADDGPTVMALNDGKVIGAAMCNSDGRSPAIHVIEAERNRGIGTALLRSLERQCADMGIERMFFPGNDCYGYGAPLEECRELGFFLKKGWEFTDWDGGDWFSELMKFDHSGPGTRNAQKILKQNATAPAS